MPSSERKLRRWYNTFNSKLFSGKLPSDTMLRWEVVDGGQAEAIEQINGVFLIRLNPAISWSLRNSKMALIHEMAHLNCWPYLGHGKIFQEEMMRLASMGAFKLLW